MKRRIAIVATHPVPYQAPWYRALAAHPALDLEVLYCHRASPANQAEAGFGCSFDWDIPLLDGYRYRFLPNRAARPSVTTFSGVDSPEVGALIRRNRYHAVIVSGWHFKAAWQAFRACWIAGTPIMVRGDSHLKQARGFLRSCLKYFPYKTLIPRLDACLAAGSWSTEYFRHYGARPDRIFVVPHTCDQRLFHHSGPRRESIRSAARRAWGISPAAMVFLLAGKLTPTKRPLDFVHAIAAASPRHPNIVGVVAGDGALRLECADLARRIGAPLIFTGFLNQTQIVDAYAAADWVVLCSQSESWGLVVNEAMTSGRPCIVSDRVGCAPELIHTGETGFVYPVGDIAALAERFASCVQSAERLPLMSAHLERAISNFSASQAVGGVLRALEAIGV